MINIEYKSMILNSKWILYMKQWQRIWECFTITLYNLSIYLWVKKRWFRKLNAHVEWFGRDVEVPTLDIILHMLCRTTKIILFQYPNCHSPIWSYDPSTPLLLCNSSHILFNVRWGVVFDYALFSLEQAQNSDYCALFKCFASHYIGVCFTFWTILAHISLLATISVNP